MTPPQNDAQNDQIHAELKSRIAFTKASACGNDFLIVDTTKHDTTKHDATHPEATHPAGDLSALTRRLCDRHRGVGADGVEWLFPDADADVSARLFNADGSEAEISGNGTRCVASLVAAETARRVVVIETVFSWPGSGFLLSKAIINRDVPVLQGTILALSLIFVVTNLIVDLLQSLVDPRLRRG